MFIQSDALWAAVISAEGRHLARVIGWELWDGASLAHPVCVLDGGAAAIVFRDHNVEVYFNRAAAQERVDNDELAVAIAKLTEEQA